MRRLMIITVLVAGLPVLAACGSEEEVPCFEENQIGSCKYLCTQGNEAACKKEAELGKSGCLLEGDISTCDLVCSAEHLQGNHPASAPYCEKLKELCANPENAGKEVCGLYIE